MCALVYNETPFETSQFNFSTLVQQQKSSENETTMLDSEFQEDEWNYDNVVIRVIVPAICAFGIFGNLLTTVVLVRRMKDNIDMLEKGSLMGMLGLSQTFC